MKRDRLKIFFKEYIEGTPEKKIHKKLHSLVGLGERQSPS